MRSQAYLCILHRFRAGVVISGIKRQHRGRFRVWKSAVPTILHENQNESRKGKEGSDAYELKSAWNRTIFKFEMSDSSLKVWNEMSGTCENLLKIVAINESLHLGSEKSPPYGRAQRLTRPKCCRVTPYRGENLSLLLHTSETRSLPRIAVKRYKNNGWPGTTTPPLGIELEFLIQKVARARASFFKIA